MSFIIFWLIVIEQVKQRSTSKCSNIIFSNTSLSEHRGWLGKKWKCCSGCNLAAAEKQQIAWIIQQRWPGAWIQARPSYLNTTKNEEREPWLQSTLYSRCHAQLWTFVKLVFSTVLVNIQCNYEIDARRELYFNLYYQSFAFPLPKSNLSHLKL